MFTLRKGASKPLPQALLCILGGVSLACSTEDPPENYFTGAARAPGATPIGSNGTGGTGGGGFVAAGGSGGVISSGGQPNVAGAAGETAASGGTSASGGSGGTSSGGTGGGAPLHECGEPPISNAPFTKQALRAAAADCVLYQYCVFEGHAKHLEGAVVELAQAASASSDKARSAWQGAMASWQQLELFQFGPAANRSMGAGKDTFQGQGVREKIYAWPTTARCRVDEQVVGRSFVDQGMDGALISGRGLYALETLLFYEGGDSACAAATPTAKAWATLAPPTLAAYKLDYAVAVAEDVVDLVQGLTHAWSPEGDNFRQVFVSASGYPSEQAAMNVLGWALAYLEKEVKDFKLGIPAGYTLKAPVTELEAPYAGTAHKNLVNNLLGFRSLFQGCGPNGEGIGFDDWLEEAGHADLASDMVSAWQNAHAVLQTLPPLQEASDAELDSAYLALKALTDLLKNDFLGAGSPINLDAPPTIQGDTD